MRDTTKAILSGDTFAIPTKPDRPWKAFVFRDGPLSRGKNDSIYSTPYTREVKALCEFYDGTVDHLRFLEERNLLGTPEYSKVLNSRWYYLASKGVQLWPFVHDPNSIERTLYGVVHQMYRHCKRGWIEPQEATRYCAWFMILLLIMAVDRNFTHILPSWFWRY